MDQKILDVIDERIPRWDLGILIDRKCPFCNGEGGDCFIRPDGLTVRWCPLCRALYVSPCPGDSQLRVFYETYHRQHRTSLFRDRKGLKRKICEMRPEEDYRIIEIISMMNPNGAKVLDIGCGLGQFLYAFQCLGSEVYGVDFDPDAVSFVKEELGIVSVYGPDSDDFEMDEYYDLIILHDLIEHPVRPIAIIEKCSRLLRKDGLLFIWTPSATFALEEDQPRLLRVDLEHMQYMHAKTVQYLSEEYGFVIVHLENVGFMSYREILAHRNRDSTLFQFFQRAKGILKGHTVANHLITIGRKLSRSRNERSGTYHLFVILRKDRSGHPPNHRLAL